MHQLAETPAVRRLQWILDGLDGVAGWGTDAAGVLAPALATVVAPEQYVDFCRARSTLSPVRSRASRPIGSPPNRCRSWCLRV
jgi:hypothetical protein